MSHRTSGPDIDVSIANETDGEIPEQRLRAAIAAVAADAGCSALCVSIAVVDDPTIHRLNRRFLEHDYPTDVLSFVLEESAGRVEGEIIVSRDTAERCAVEAGWSSDEELLLYVIHGALHLAGRRDKSPLELAEMLAAETRVLESLGIPRATGDSRWHASPDAAESDPAVKAAASEDFPR